MGLIYLLSYSFTSLLIYSYQDRPGSVSRPEIKEATNAGYNFYVLILCCSIFSYECMFDFVVLDLVFQYETKRLAGKNVSEITYFVSGGT